MVVGEHICLLICENYDSLYIVIDSTSVRGHTLHTDRKSVLMGFFEILPVVKEREVYCNGTAGVSQTGGHSRYVLL